MPKIAVVGQTPPPYGGQTLMIGRLLSGHYDDATLIHVPMAFSDSLDEMGHVRVSKVLELLRVVARILRVRIWDGARILYYPPAPPFLVPVLRDLAILGATRWMFRTTIFHFHAGGVSTIYDRLPRPLRPLFRLAYFDPEIAIRTSESAPQDGKRLGARVEYVIANGIEDVGSRVEPNTTVVDDTPLILHVGLLSEAKGILDLVEACGLLREHGTSFDLVLAGPVESSGFASRLEALLKRRDLCDRTELPGPVSGERKWALFRRAAVFCSPSRHPMETFGLAAVEALCFGLPVVASRWRGLAEIVGEGECGLLAEPGNPESLAAALARLLSDPRLRRSLGEAGRHRFLERYSLERHRQGLQTVFERAAAELRNAG